MQYNLSVVEIIGGHMTVKELLETNMFLCDVQITARTKDGWLLDELNIGPDFGVVPPYPQMVPKNYRYVGTQNECDKKQAQYVRKNINAYDDGKEYFQLFLNRFPKGWLELEVESWRPTSGYYRYHMRNRPIDGWQAVRITAIPYEETLVVLEEPKEITQKQEQLEGQMNIMDYLE